MKTDAELITTAERAGWVWSPESGWIEGNSTHCCRDGDRAAILRPDSWYRAFLYGERRFDHDYECRHCGKPIWLSWLHNRELIEQRECFHCNHSMGLHRRRDENSVVMLNPQGQRAHYIIGAEGGPDRSRGFGGHPFTIRFIDGRIVRTTNL